MTGNAVETVTIPPGEPGGRLDRVLAARIPALSRSRLKALILTGQVNVQGANAARTVRDPAAQVNSGDTITVLVNGKEVVRWTQPPDWAGTKEFPARKIAPGTIALQGHDPGSTTHYRNIQVRLLRQVRVYS
jgi:ribosomal 50S subunit-recycling heat shock protein